MSWEGVAIGGNVRSDASEGQWQPGEAIEPGEIPTPARMSRDQLGISVGIGMRTPTRPSERGEVG